jgi:hypothetical protein
VSTVTPLNGSPLSGGGFEEELQLQTEYRRLQLELTAARDRVTAAQQRIAARDAEIQAVLRNELRLAQDELAALGQQHESALEELRATTDADVARLLASEPDDPQVPDVE